MSHFTETEIAYLNEQRLGRLATVNADRQPHVVPVGFGYDAETDTIVAGGLYVAGTKRARDVRANERVALVVDDVASVDPWRVRGIEVRGTAELVTEGGQDLGPGFGPAFLRITPRRIVAWGVETDQYTANSRSVG
jgi:pyridoxamine 5'-phosphate oxidase family protein